MLIKAVVLDVDGVLTDGTVAVDASGAESKRISFADIMGVSNARRAGLLFAFVTGEQGPVLDQIAAKFGVLEVYGGCWAKAAAVREFAAAHDVALEQVCFIGDDINDLPAFDACGLSAAPADAHPVARQGATLVTSRGGGNGAVREFLDDLLEGNLPDGLVSQSHPSA